MGIPDVVSVIAWVFTYGSIVIELAAVLTLLVAVLKDRCKALNGPAEDFFKAGGHLRTTVLFLLAFMLLIASRNVRIGGRSVLIAISLICQRYAYLSAYLLGLAVLVEIVIAVKKLKDQETKRLCRNMEITTGVSMVVGYLIGYFMYIPY